jgi:hypothetical protein
MSIEEITIEENDLLNLVHQYKGDMDLTFERMQKDEIFKKYSDIHSKYVELATKEENIEALKRAIFIQWYALSEPSSFTGIRDLSEDNKKRALRFLEMIIIENKIDTEFNSMLFHYKEVNNIAFTQFNNYQILKNYLNNISEYNHLENLAKFSFNKRGQLGSYWQSILNKKTV